MGSPPPPERARDEMSTSDDIGFDVNAK